MVSEDCVVTVFECPGMAMECALVECPYFCPEDVVFTCVGNVLH